jgi:hypothetical protein
MVKATTLLTYTRKDFFKGIQWKKNLYTNQINNEESFCFECWLMITDVNTSHDPLGQVS